MTFTPKFPDLVTMFEHAVEQFPNRPLFGTKKSGTYHWMTYREAGEKVAAFRAALAGLGVQAGDKVAAVSNNRVEWAVGAFACYGLGAAYVPMYENQLDKEWKYILNDCGAKVCLAGNDAVYGHIERLRAEIPTLKHAINFEGQTNDETSYEHLLKCGAGKSVPPRTPDPKEIAMFIYTSGTTGNPKGVRLSHSNLGCNVSAIRDLLPIGPTDRTLAFLPWAHVFGGSIELNTMISVGGALGLAEKVETIVDNLAEVKPTLLLAVPRIWNRIYDGVQKQIAGKPKIIQTIFHNGMSGQSKQKKNQPLTLGEKISLPLAKVLIFKKIVHKFGGELKYAISGAAALSPEVAEFIDNLGITVYEGYGMTESSGAATCNSPKACKLGSVGVPVPGIQIKIDHNVPGGNESEGEIIIYGHGVMDGYHNLPEMTKETFTNDRGLRSGDLGRIDEYGFLHITGRVKELYKLENGKYVAPAPIEETITLSPFIAQAMVYGDNQLYNVALIVPDFVNLEEWAKAKGIDASSREKLIRDAQVITQIEKEITEQSEKLKGYERVKKFKLITQEFTPDNDMLTPTLKLKRRNVMKNYEGDIQKLYK